MDYLRYTYFVSALIWQRPSPTWSSIQPPNEGPHMQPWCPSLSCTFRLTNLQQCTLLPFLTSTRRIRTLMTRSFPIWSGVQCLQLFCPSEAKERKLLSFQNISLYFILRMSIVYFVFSSKLNHGPYRGLSISKKAATFAEWFTVSSLTQNGRVTGWHLKRFVKDHTGMSK